MNVVNDIMNKRRRVLIMAQFKEYNEQLVSRNATLGARDGLYVPLGCLGELHTF
jgi:hypothetical protein